MKYSYFNARCPFEIGDKVLDQNSGRVYEITDIMCIHRVRAGTVTFRYELNNSGRYVEIGPALPQEERERTGDERTPLPPEFSQFIKRRFG